jgi:possible TPS family two-partner secretion exoprotein tpsA
MLVGNGVVSRVVSKVEQVQNNRLPLENTLIWNKITPVYSDISPTFIPRVFITKSAGKILY